MCRHSQLPAPRSARCRSDVGRRAAVAWPRNRDVRSLLGTIFGASPYLSHLILVDPAFLHRSLVVPPDETLSDLIQALDRDMGAAENADEVMTHLRTFKKRVALLTALSDIAGNWDVMQTTEALSQAADSALKQAVRFAFRVAAQHGAYRHL